MIGTVVLTALVTILGMSVFHLVRGTQSRQVLER